jgi:hypothetical protein
MLSYKKWKKWKIQVKRGRKLILIRVQDGGGGGLTVM